MSDITESETDPMSNNRRETRQRTFLKGRIIFNNGSSSMDCLVRDMSASGARLALTETASLPEIFELYIPQKDRSYRSTLRWRRTDGMGITFIEEDGGVAPHPAAAAVAPVAPVAPAEDDAASMLMLVRRVSELETENATLRRLLADLSRTREPANAA